MWEKFRIAAMLVSIKPDSAMFSTSLEARVKERKVPIVKKAGQRD